MIQVKFTDLEPGSLFYVNGSNGVLPWVKLALIQDSGNCVDSDGFVCDAPWQVWINNEDPTCRIKGAVEND